MHCDHCNNLHGYASYYYNTNDSTIYWFCSRKHKDEWRQKHCTPEDGEVTPRVNGYA